MFQIQKKRERHDHPKQEERKQHHTEGEGENEGRRSIITQKGRGKAPMLQWNRVFKKKILFLLSFFTFLFVFFFTSFWYFSLKFWLLYFLLFFFLLQYYTLYWFKPLLDIINQFQPNLISFILVLRPVILFRFMFQEGENGTTIQNKRKAAPHKRRREK